MDNDDGSVWTWCNDEAGQLGDGTTIESHVPKKVSDNVSSVSIGHNHMFSFKKDNTLWSAGSNLYGQLGDGYVSTVKAPVKVLEDVQQVAYSEHHTLAIKKDGTLWAWGKNSSGELWGMKMEGMSAVGKFYGKKYQCREL